MLGATLAAVAALAGAPQASAPAAAVPGVLYETFQTACVAADAEPAQALAAADAQGWMTLNKALVPFPDNANFSLTDYGVRLKSDAAGIRVLLAGKGFAKSVGTAQTLPANVCMVMAKPGDASALERAKAWSAVEPLATQEGMIIYAFTQPSGVHKSLVASRDAERDLKGGAARMVIVGTPKDQDASILIYARMAP